MTIPKSLHTVTVLVAVARTMKGAPAHTMNDCQLAVGWAAEMLGYEATYADTHDLLNKAAVILLREVQKANNACREACTRLDALPRCRAAALPDFIRRTDGRVSCEPPRA